MYMNFDLIATHDNKFYSFLYIAHDKRNLRQVMKGNNDGYFLQMDSKIIVMNVHC